MSRAKRFERLRCAALEVGRLEKLLQKAHDERRRASYEIAKKDSPATYFYEGCVICVPQKEGDSILIEFDAKSVDSDDLEADDIVEADENEPSYPRYYKGGLTTNIQLVDGDELE